MTYDPRYPFDAFNRPLVSPLQAENNRLRQLLMQNQMEIAQKKRELDEARKLPSLPKPPEWQVQMQANLRAVSDQVAALHRKVDEMVTFQKSKGRTVVIDKKTGKPRAPSARMSVSKRIAVSKSKRVKVSKRAKGSFNRP